MGKRTEGDCLRELQDYFDQRARIEGDNPPLWEHASEMCVAMLQDMGATDAGPLTSLYTRIIGEMVISVNKASMAAAIAKENQALLDKQSQERHDWWIGEKRKAERLEVEKKSLDAKVIDLQRQVKQANADEHNALSVVDRLKGELVDTQKSLDASRAKRADLLNELHRLRAACRLTDGELEALAAVNRDRTLIDPGPRLVQLANFVGRVRAVLEPNTIDAMPAETEEAPRDGTVAVVPAQRLRAVEQELAIMLEYLEGMANDEHLREGTASVARRVRDRLYKARKERGC